MRMNRKMSPLKLTSIFLINLMIVWPFKLIRWCFRKIKNLLYDINFADYNKKISNDKYLNIKNINYDDVKIKKHYNEYNPLNTLEENVGLFYETQFSKEAKTRVDDKSFILHYIIKNKAWRDATIRERFNNDSEIIKNKEKIINFLENEILNNADNISYDYNEWHNSICELNIFNMRYGVWQKLINMTFKYLYCVKDVFPEFSDIWGMCHCPIDTVIAKQIHNKLVKMNINRSELILSDKISKSDPIINWNYISRKDYFTLQEQVRFICKKEKICPIEFDFLYWKK